MANLDQPQALKELDRENMLQHIEELPDQIEQAWKEMQDFVIPTPYIKVKNAVILGMGGSGNGALLLKHLALARIKIPIEIVQDYTLPGYVSSDTLVVAISYSGQTEETLAAFREAGNRQAKLVAISIGGELSSLASRFKTPTYRINYGSPPRAALGYTYTAVLSIFYKLGFLELGKDDIKESVVLMRGLRAKVSPDVPTYQNDAKKLAQRLVNAHVCVVGSGSLIPAAYRWATALNENAKHLASALVLPEISHNWLVGLEFPAEAVKSLFMVILQSKYDNPRNRLRQNIISQILHKRGITHEFVFVQPSGSMFSEQMLTTYLGDFVSYYVAMLEDIDPTPIDVVDYLKRNLENVKY